MPGYQPNWSWLEQNALASMSDAFGDWENALARFREFGQDKYGQNFFDPAYRQGLVGPTPAYQYDPFMASRVSAPIEASLGALIRSQRADALRGITEEGAFGGAGQARKAELAGEGGARALTEALAGARQTGVGVAGQAAMGNLQAASQAQALRTELARDALAQRFQKAGMEFAGAENLYGARYSAMLNQLMSALGYGGELGVTQATKKKDIWDIIGTFL